MRSGSEMPIEYTAQDCGEEALYGKEPLEKILRRMPGLLVVSGMPVRGIVPMPQVYTHRREKLCYDFDRHSLKNMKITTLVWILTSILVVGIGWYFSKNDSPTFSPDQNLAVSSSEQADVVSASDEHADIPPRAPMTTPIVYGPNGFSPATVTIKKGDTVTFTNQGGDKMWVASNIHPTHEGYSGTIKNQHCPDTAGIAFDQCSVGTTYSFTFQKAGAWSYHNHTHSSISGIIIVK